MIFRTLLSQWSSIVISLFLAVFVWAVATNEENPTRTADFQDPVPVQFLNRSENLALVYKSKDSVQIQVRASEDVWKTLRADNFRATVDLKDLSAGTYTLPVTVTSADPKVTVVAPDPSTVSVQLDLIKQVKLDVRVQVLDAPPVGYEVKNASANPATVTISGPQSFVDQINDATADIALRGAKTSLDRDVTVALHDAQGNTVQNVTVTPATVSVHLDVVQRVGYKEVAVKAVLKGNPSTGYWVSNIGVDPPTVTLVGSPEALNRIPGFVEAQAVTVTGAREDVTKQVGLNLPQGVTALNVGNVNVRVSVEPVLGGITVRRTVTISEVRCDLPVTVSPDTVEVILSGPLPILQALTPDDIQILVEVNSCSPASFQVSPDSANVPNSVKVESIVPNTVEVNVKPR